jgi:hypothetical protein
MNNGPFAQSENKLDLSWSFSHSTIRRGAGTLENTVGSGGIRRGTGAFACQPRAQQGHPFLCSNLGLQAKAPTIRRARRRNPLFSSLSLPGEPGWEHSRLPCRDSLRHVFGAETTCRRQAPARVLARQARVPAPRNHTRTSVRNAGWLECGCPWFARNLRSLCDLRVLSSLSFSASPRLSG